MFLHLYVAEARGLPVSDNHGRSDPYLKFKVNGKKYRTGTVNERLNPIWTSHFTVDKLKGNEELELTVWDADSRLSKQDLLGIYPMKVSKIPDEGMCGWCSLLDGESKQPSLETGELRLMAWLQKEGGKPDMKARDKAFADLLDAEKKSASSGSVEVFVGSWNVGNAQTGDLSDWIPKDKYPVYVIGAQECEYKAREGCKTCMDDWVKYLSEAIGEKAKLLKCKSLGQMRLAIFCTDDARGNITNIISRKEATGIGHVINNKGGTGVGFKYKDTRMLFINAHLAAHQGEVVRRNSDVQEILQGVATTLTEVPGNQITGDYDHIIFLGDLNYRLDYGDQGDKKKPSKALYKEMCQMVEKEKFSELFAKDQLTRELKAGNVMAGFTEGSYKHPPTFKVIKGKKLEYNEERSPAYCDRVLWLSNTKDQIKDSGVRAAIDVITSDHKPISNILQIPYYSLAMPIQDDAKKCIVTFNKLSVSGLPTMDNNGLCDPYVDFLSALLPTTGKTIKTEVVKKSLDASFKKIPKLPLVVSNKERVETHSLTLRVWDSDFASKDDLVGCATIRFHEVFSKGEQSGIVI